MPKHVAKEIADAAGVDRVSAPIHAAAKAPSPDADSSASLRLRTGTRASSTPRRTGAGTSSGAALLRRALRQPSHASSNC